MVSAGSLNCKLCDLKNSFIDSVAISNNRDDRSSDSVGREETISFSESDFPLLAYDGSLMVRKGGYGNKKNIFMNSVNIMNVFFMS